MAIWLRKINDGFFDPGQRVFSGLSAILDFQIIHFREYDCSIDIRLPNCQIVELFLTVDTSRKIQNGVNIDISIDRWDFSNFFTRIMTIFRGMDILKNDVNAILGQIFDMKLQENKRFFTTIPGLNKNE